MHIYLLAQKRMSYLAQPSGSMKMEYCFSILKQNGASRM